MRIPLGREADGRVMIYGTGHGTMWMTWCEDGPDHEPTGLNLPDLLGRHLVEGEIAIVIEAGSERLRYIHGWADAIVAGGDHLRIDLNAIYDMATEKWPGSTITKAEW